MGDPVADVVREWGELRPHLDLTGMAVFGRVARLARLAERARSHVYERHGLQNGDFDVLGPLYRHRGGLRPVELRHRMLVGSGTLTPRIDRLEAAGLLERHPDPQDRRGRVLRLTSLGEELVPEVVEELLAVENELLSRLSERTRTRLSADLERLLVEVERSSAP